VASGIGVQRLGGRAEQVEQGQRVLPRGDLVVPLHEEQQRHRDPAGFVVVAGQPRPRRPAEQAQHRGADARLGRHQRHAVAGAHGHAPVAHRAGAHVVLRLQGVERGGPVADGALGSRLVAPLGPHPLAHPATAVLAGQAALLLGHAVTVIRQVDGGRGDAVVADQPAGQGRDVGNPLVLGAAVPEQHQRARPGRGRLLGRPQHARH
jgi:hypothetical protein